MAKGRWLAEAGTAGGGCATCSARWRLVIARDHIDPAAVAVERHAAVYQGEKGVILAAANPTSGVELCAHLAD